MENYFSGLYDTFYLLFYQIENCPDWLLNFLTVAACFTVIWMIPTIICMIGLPSFGKKIFGILTCGIYMCLLAYFFLPALKLPDINIVKTLITASEVISHG